MSFTGCVYESNVKLATITNQYAKPVIHSGDDVYLLWNRCDGDLNIFSGFMKVDTRTVDDEMYVTPQFSPDMSDGTIIKLRKVMGQDGAALKWSDNIVLDTATGAWGSTNGYIIGCQKPPTGAYVDIRVSKNFKLARNTRLNNNPDYPADDEYIRAGDIFSIDGGRCLFTVIPYITYIRDENSPNICSQYVDTKGDLIYDYYSPDNKLRAFTDPCECNPAAIKCLTGAEEHEVMNRVADGENDYLAGLDVVIKRAQDGKRSIQRRRLARSEQQDKEINQYYLAIGILFVLVAILLTGYLYSKKR